jgi:Ni/Co efflux regulator RcnB
MKKLLAVIVAAAFASVAFAQSKDVTDKKGSTVTDKKGSSNVTTKDVKEKKQHPMPKLPKAEAKKKEPKTPGNVATKRGESVTDKKGAEVKSGQK